MLSNIVSILLHVQDRMWRKTRSNYGTFCVGVDPNRNFDAGWSGPGASNNPCSDTYYGPEVESEQLTKGLSNFIKSNQGKIEVYLAANFYFGCAKMATLWGGIVCKSYPFTFDRKNVFQIYEKSI